MKRHYFWLMSLLVIAVLAACNKKDDAPPFDPVKQAAIDEQLIQKYIADSSLTGVLKDDTSALRYKIIERANPVVMDTIALDDRFRINYRGRLLNGQVFDQGSNTTLRELRLKDLIEGWKIGMRKAAVGDSILLIVPSALGYGNRANGIPANSVMVFNIRIKEFYF